MTYSSGTKSKQNVLVVPNAFPTLINNVVTIYYDG